MGLLTTTLTEPWQSADMLRRRGHGMIEVCRGRLTAIRLRRLPKIASALEIEYLGRRWHASMPGDRCLLYYNQPRSCPNFLALKYTISQRDCTLATIQRALQTLDEVARIKRCDAIVCDVWNVRISERMLVRYGWQAHKPQRWHRNYIKRFYGVYPAPPASLSGAELLPFNSPANEPPITCAVGTARE